jgi:TfoX/Sxy family transcriptional regulator of competence genes
MATQKTVVEFIESKLGHRERLHTKAMFGEYALYADGKVAALICDDLLYVKIMPASQVLESICEVGEPYPNAKPCYIVTEDQMTSIEDLPQILFAIAESLPAKKVKRSTK